MNKISAQDEYGPNGTCFGCGPTNEKGLKIKSFWEGDDFVLRFNPETHHQGFPGAVNGGIIGSLFDCHMNWCAATTIFKNKPDELFPSTVTAEFSVKLTAPTPTGVELLIKARPVETKGSMVRVETELYANNKITAKSTGVFIAVKPGHPAYHRWD